MVQGLLERGAQLLSMSRSSFVSSEHEQPTYRSTASTIAHTSPSRNTGDPVASAWLPFGLLANVGTFATLMASPFVFAVTKQLHPQSLPHIQRLVDEHWHSLPAISQELLYDAGYRNIGLESQSRTQRAKAFPSTPEMPLSSRRIVTKASDGSHASTVATVFGWPSSGELLALDVSKVNMNAAGLSMASVERFALAVKPATSIREEDAFCEKLRSLGATTYTSIEEYRLSSIPPLRHDDMET